MNIYSMLRALVLVSALVLLPVSSFAGDGAGGSISNVFVDSDLRQAVEDISAQANVNIVMDPAVQGVVSATLDHATVDRALQLLLAGTDFQFAAFPNYYLVFPTDPNNGSFAEVSKTRVVQAKNLPAADIQKLLPNALQRYVRVDTSTDKIAVTAPPQLMGRIVDNIATLDQPSDVSTDFVSLHYVKAATVQKLLPDSLQRFVKVDAERNTLAISAPKGSHQEIMNQIAKLDVPRGNGSFDVPPDLHRTHLVKLENATAETTLALLPKPVQPFVQADKVTNTIAISAPDVMVPQIMADIRTIDTPRQHILLDARVVALERADLLDFGGQWKMPTISAGTVIGDAVKWPWEMRIGYTPDRQFTDALSLTLNLLSQNNEATIISSPQVLAQDGKEADIHVTNEEYFPITSTVGNTTVQNTLEKIETGTILKITPQVGNNGDINLDMDIEVSDVVARGEQNLPVVIRRTAHSTVQLHNGGTAAVAGLLDTRSQRGDKGIPGAQDLPLLGRAFRTQTLDHQARQVAVFITATIVRDGDQQFKTGQKPHPAAKVADKATYREELAAALSQMGSAPAK